MTSFYDTLETRTADERAFDLARALPAQIERAKGLEGYKTALGDVVPEEIRSVEDMRAIPVLRKSSLAEAQQNIPPLGGYNSRPVHEFDALFQSPGRIYEPGVLSGDWWRLARFLHAAGIGMGDIVQNCFSYHLTPAGQMFDSAARRLGASVIPAGIGQTALQMHAARDLQVTAYAGTPDYLKVILEKADADGITLSLKKAVVGGGALHKSLRSYYDGRGITCLQCYATADLGNIAYESVARDGLIVEENVVVEIVAPGTGDPVPEGQIGEVVVTSLNPDYPLVRFATGDLSAVMPGQSPCGRTNLRLVGWMGRVDQTTKIKGMFVSPTQVNDFKARHAEVQEIRVIASRTGEQDVMTVRIEGDPNKAEVYSYSIAELFKLRGKIEVVAPGSLPKDGQVIEDQRTYSS